MSLQIEAEVKVNFTIDYEALAAKVIDFTLDHE